MTFLAKCPVCGDLLDKHPSQLGADRVTFICLPELVEVPKVLLDELVKTDRVMEAAGGNSYTISVIGDVLSAARALRKAIE